MAEYSNLEIAGVIVVSAVVGGGIGYGIKSYLDSRHADDEKKKMREDLRKEFEEDYILTPKGETLNQAKPAGGAKVEEAEVIDKSSAPQQAGPNAGAAGQTNASASAQGSTQDADAPSYSGA